MPNPDELNIQTPENTQTPELTPWDLFICVAGRPEGIALTRLAHVLQVDKERTLIRPMGELAEMGLVVDHGDRYSLSTAKYAQNFKNTLDYAIAYNYDYNAFLRPEMKDFLTLAYRHDYFTEYDLGKEKLYPEVIARLLRNKLLIVYSFKPFRGKLVQNPFLDGLCAFLDVHKGSLFSGMFRKKLPLERIIREKLQSDSKEQIAAAKKLLGDELLSRDFSVMPANIIALKKSVMHEDTEVFDEASTKSYKRAWEKMHQYIKEGKRLSIDLIKEYHSICMENTDLGGKFRDFEVVIRNNPHFKTAPPNKVVFSLLELVSYIGMVTCESISEKLETASTFYNQFIYIHPFEDGNSRLARILLGHILNEYGLPFEEIPNSYEVRFLMATKGYRKRNDHILKEMLEEIYISYLNMKELDDALNLEEKDIPKKVTYNYDHYGKKPKSK